MKLDGPLGKAPAGKLTLRDFSKPSKESVEARDGSIQDSTQLDLTINSFKLLAKHDRRAATFEPERIKKNLDNGYEALVQFKDSKSKAFVLSVRHESEIGEYAALHSGGEVEAATKELFYGLKTSEKFGNRFYFKRGDQHLKTDAAGATISLNRGSRVVVKRGDGQHETHTDPKKALDFLGKIDHQAAQAQKELAAAKKAGLKFEPIPDEDAQPKSTLQTILDAFEGVNEFDIDKNLADSLTAKGKLQVSFENDKRPMPLPLSLNRDEIKVAAGWEKASNPEIKAFKEDFASLVDKKTILMTQTPDGPMKGMILKADDRAAYFQLKNGARVVALDGKGDIHELKSLKDFRTFKTTGQVSVPVSDSFDGSKTDSDNLMMFYHVSPFDPIEKGNYDDLPRRITDVGSSPQLDIVTMRSDLPNKNNLRVDRAQQGELQELYRLPPETAMSDPKVLENFVYKTVKSNLGDDKIRFLVGGHGGAEKGLLPDGKHNNSAADMAMPVDKFAGAISKALDRVEQETGKRPKIDNLMLVSCLMGNTSFIHALAQTGDIETLVASPELMAGSNPISTFEYLADPKTSKASGREYAQYLVDEWSEAPAMIGGSKETRHADTIGAYDLSPHKAKRFQKALGGFFEAAVAEPKYAEYLKENIAKAPSYGMNPLVNVLFDVDNRDLIQVLDHAGKDARISSPKLKAAMKELKDATEAQVIDQKVSKNYQGRRGPSLYLPLDSWDFNNKMADTQLLKSVKYREFMNLIFDAPLQRSVAANIINEVSRISESGVLDKAVKKLMDAATGKKPKSPEPPEKKSSKNSSKTEPAEVVEQDVTTSKQLDFEFQEKASDDFSKLFSSLANAVSPEAEELRGMRELEEQTSRSLVNNVFDKISRVVSASVGLASGLVGAALGGSLGAVAGLGIGAVAGWRGVSLSGTHRPASKAEMEVLTNVVDKFLEANGLNSEEKNEEKTSAQNDLDAAFDSFNAKSAATEEQLPLELSQPSAAPLKTEKNQREAEKVETVLEVSGPPDPKSLDLKALDGLLDGRIAKTVTQLLLWPSESFAIKTHETVGRTLGEVPGRVAGAVAGAVSGAVFNALAVAGVGFAGVGLLGEHMASSTLDKIAPKEPDKGEVFFTGRFEDDSTEPQ